MLNIIRNIDKGLTPSYLLEEISEELQNDKDIINALKKEKKN